MARSTPRLCARCGVIVPGQCPICSVGWSVRKPASWAGSIRGDARWKRIRATYLRDHPLCEWPGCRALASTVDHVDGTDYETERYDFDKLRSLCEPHHRKRTAAQGHAAQGHQPTEG